ncbi:hypothetical protein [Halobacterium salinarum]|uniref:hypothetical protein n=1 Tax=Halobacterium salinarum TaxID=2242 RepID=UPI0025551C8F|nr:hypothetical protein [Halobacterium salinarum]MDL0127081.1 hypothetical protein [Halobacterium salinarum]
MSLRESLRDRVEQLAPGDGDETAEPDPRGEHRRVTTTERDDEGIVSWVLGYASPSPSTDAVSPEHRDAPVTIASNWENYYQDFALTRAPLHLFDEAVIEPGYKIRVEDASGERDRDMEEALDLWASNCVIHAGELGHDLRKLLGSLPSKRRGKGTVLIEKVGTSTDPDAMVALMSLDPSTFKMHTRPRQPILIQPDDAVDSNHPRTPSGKAAAYTQYHQDVPGHGEKDPIHFATSDILKLTYDADDGEVWGTSVFDAISDRIDALRQKLKDRDFAIRQTGYPHRIYSSKNWSQDEAEAYAEAHKEGDVSSEYGPEDDDDDRGGEKNSFAGRVDFVPDEVDVQVESGTVPNLESAIRDDVEQIFSVMPVGKYQIAYADDLNQFVVDPQREQDKEAVDSERQYLERKFEPIFKEKADELASGDQYNGTVFLTIEPPEDENPLRRESFPADNLKAFANAWKAFKSSGAEQDLPAAAFAEFAGFDLEEKQQEYDWEADPLEIADEDDTQEAMDEVTPDNTNDENAEEQEDDNA